MNYIEKFAFGSVTVLLQYHRMISEAVRQLKDFSGKKKFWFCKSFLVSTDASGEKALGKGWGVLTWGFAALAVLVPGGLPSRSQLWAWTLLFVGRKCLNTCKCCVGKAAVFPVVVQCWHKGDLYRVQQRRAVGSVALPPGGPRVLPRTLWDVELRC